MHKEFNFNVAIPSFLDIEIYFISGDRVSEITSHFSIIFHILEQLTCQGCGTGRDGCSAPDSASLGLCYNLWQLISASTTWGA